MDNNILGLPVGPANHGSDCSSSRLLLCFKVTQRQRLLRLLEIRDERSDEDGENCKMGFQRITKYYLHNAIWISNHCKMTQARQKHKYQV